jgi:hypothetical protein
MAGISTTRFNAGEPPKKPERIGMYLVARSSLAQRIAQYQPAAIVTM